MAKAGLWAVKDVTTGKLVKDRFTMGVTFSPREKARAVKRRSRANRNLRVVPVTVNKLHNRPRA